MVRRDDDWYFMDKLISKQNLSEANMIRHLNREDMFVLNVITNKEVGNTCHIVKCQAMCMLD